MLFLGGGLVAGECFLIAAAAHSLEDHRKGPAVPRRGAVRVGAMDGLALMDGHVYRRLVGDRGWTTAQFTQWLYQSVAAVLLPSAARTAGQDGTARASEP